VLVRIYGGPIKPDVALPKVERCLELDPYDVDARRAVAFYSLLTSDFDRARAEAAKCLEQVPSDTRSAEILLECAVKERKWDEASSVIERYGQCLNSAKGLRLRGRWLLEAGRTAEAETFLRKAVELDPSSQEAHFLLVRALRTLGRKEEAKPYFRRFKELTEHKEILSRLNRITDITDPRDWQPPEPEQCVELALHCSGIGLTKLARGWLNEALRQRPNYQAAIAALAQLERGDTISMPGGANEKGSPKKPQKETETLTEASASATSKPATKLPEPDTGGIKVSER